MFALNAVNIAELLLKNKMVKILEYYPWQKVILNHKGDMVIRGTRQGGKTETVAELIYSRAMNYPGLRSLIIGASERQENFLYEIVRDKIGGDYVGRSTLTYTKLPNGHEIFKFPIGTTGKFLEGLASVDFLYVEEGIHVKDKAMDSIIPMLAEPSGRGFGWSTYLSSTMGKPKGFFFDACTNKNFLEIQVRAKMCPHISKEFLAKELERLGQVQFDVVYNGEFDENANKYFPKEVVMRNVRIGSFSKKDIDPNGEYYGGIDPATSGRSKAAWGVIRILGKRAQILHGEEMQTSTFTEMRSKTIQLDNLFKARRWFYDNNGLGQGFDEFFEKYKPLRRKLRGLNNREAGKFGKILKEDMYSNVLGGLEDNEIDIVDDPIIINGLLNVEVEGPPGEEKIIGTDMSEAVIRACWGIKEKYIKPRILRF